MGVSQGHSVYNSTRDGKLKAQHSTHHLIARVPPERLGFALKRGLTYSTVVGACGSIIRAAISRGKLDVRRASPEPLAAAADTHPREPDTLAAGTADEDIADMDTFGRSGC